MTRLVARILLAMLVLPLAALLYAMVIAFFAFNGMGGRSAEVVGFSIGTVITAGFVVGYWVLLWKSSVRWTAERLRNTALASIVAVTIGFIAGLLGAVTVGEGSFGIFLGGITAMITWLPMTILAWRESGDDRAERIRGESATTIFCPTCGYNMTGLKATTCPECGAQFTINELVAAQPHCEAASLESP